MKSALLSALIALASSAHGSDWKPVKAPLDTPWTDRVDPRNPLPEHPRPDFQRPAWMSLNGLWNYALEPVDFQPMQGFIDRRTMTEGKGPERYEGRILVPFAIDSPLSGIMHVLRPQERLWYQREFRIPDSWKGSRVLLHIEASDWETGVYVNDRRVGQHRGGYDPFAFDVTEALKTGDNSLRICVWDGTEQHCQPLGKQIMPENRQGFRYQPTGGIWQTVWLEAVPETRVVGWKVTPRLHGFDYEADLNDATDGLQLRVLVDGVEQKTDARGDQVKGFFKIFNPRHWSPDSPHLYDVKLELLRNGESLDAVQSYVGLRTIGRDGQGRILLNGRPAPFQFGPLDQGYWPDGILPPPHEDAIRFDIEYLKSIGCNMARVHIKIHPRRWYYHADRLGLLVWQDMVCTPKYGQTVDAAGSVNWRRELGEIMGDFHNHPSIVQWVVFNEAWGQHDTAGKTQLARQLDPSRLILSVSGWNDHGVGDTLDVHNYQFYPSAPVADGFGGRRALVFGELGGHNLLLPGKQWYPDQQNRRTVSLKRAGGRMDFESLADLAFKYPFYFRNARHFVSRYGYQGFVYTQITDVEHECNGWLTYDRRVSKLPAETFRKFHTSLSHPLKYTELLGAGDWRSGRKAPARRGPAGERPRWAAPRADLPGNEILHLPHAGGPMAEARKEEAALIMRREFALRERPERAVFEVRATHRLAHAEAPDHRLDGHHPRAAAPVPFALYLDGLLHRRGVINVEQGQGEGVAFFEFTGAELKELKPGRHLVVVELPKPEETIGFDLKLLGYADESALTAQAAVNDTAERPVLRSGKIANRAITVRATIESASPRGVVVAQGGRQHGYALHFLADGRAAFDVRINGRVSRVMSERKVTGRLGLVAEFDGSRISLRVNDGAAQFAEVAGFIPGEPTDPVSVGYDERTAAGDYSAPNPFADRIIDVWVETGEPVAKAEKRPAASLDKPNFIFFITDDISPDDLGIYGNQAIQTPNLDALATRGLVFDNALLTISSCSPSRCSIITGRYPHNTGAPELHSPLPTGQRTFVRMLQQAGYHTVISGKNHMANPTQLGFDVSSDSQPAGAEKWVEHLRERPRDRPFFAWFASHDAHHPFTPDETAPRYDPDTVPVPPMMADGPLTRVELAGYYHEVSRSDHYAGLLMQELERQGIADNTWFIYCSDNGRPFPRCKTYLYESGIRTPLLVLGPGVAHGRTDSLVSSIDIAATVLELAGMAKPESVQGVSFAKILRDPKATCRDVAFAERNWHVYRAHERMVRTGDWLYIWNAWPDQHNVSGESACFEFGAAKELWTLAEGGRLTPAQTLLTQLPQPAEMLFNVVDDPHQFTNLADRSAHAETLKRMRNLLRRWQDETGDSVPRHPTNDRQPLHVRINKTPPHGDYPGADRDATGINRSGPVQLDGTGI